MCKLTHPLLMTYSDHLKSYLVVRYHNMWSRLFVKLPRMQMVIVIIKQEIVRDITIGIDL